jgi:hypothetical protein
MSLVTVQTAAAQDGEGSPFRQAGEILMSFGQWFPDEAAMLRELWSGDSEERELAQLVYDEDPRRVAHAGPYGLVIDGTTTPRIRAIERAVRGIDK